MNNREAKTRRAGTQASRRQAKKRNRSRALHRPLGLGLESLESRRMLAGDAFQAIDDSAAELAPSVMVGRATPRIVNGDQTDQFEAVGIVNDGCTGTLIAPNVVLTAAHCVESFDGNGTIGHSDGTFEVDGKTYSTTAIVSHQGYNGDLLGTDQANDIALMVLDQNVSGVEPIEINRTTPFVGQTLTLVGFGGGGTGDSGHNGDFGTKRVGETPIDGVSETIISWNFDNNSESNTAPGDSGGPALISLDGQFFVAGVTSGGDKADAGIGDFSFDTRVDAYLDWIDAVVSGNFDPDPGDPDPGDPDPGDPDPGDPDPGDPDPSEDDHVDNIGPDATSVQIEDGFGYIDAWLETIGDHDAFQFTLDQSDSVELDLFSWEGDLDTHLAVYDADGNMIAEDAELGDSQLMLDLDAGQYYVVAGAVDDQGNGEYGLDIYVGEGGGDWGGDWGDEGDWNDGGDWGDEGDWNDGGGDWSDEGDWNDGGGEWSDEGDWNDGGGDWSDGGDGSDEGDWNDGGGDWSDEGWSEQPGGAGGDFADEGNEQSDPFDHCDVNSDSNVNVIDVYSILNVLFAGEGISVAATDESSAMDVTGDGNINPQDALRVIEYLLSNSSLLVGAGEGESAATHQETASLNNPSTELEGSRQAKSRAVSVVSEDSAADLLAPTTTSLEANDAVDELMQSESDFHPLCQDDDLLDTLLM